MQAELEKARATILGACKTASDELLDVEGRGDDGLIKKIRVKLGNGDVGNALVRIERALGYEKERRAALRAQAVKEG